MRFLAKRAAAGDLGMLKQDEARDDSAQDVWLARVRGVSRHVHLSQWVCVMCDGRRYRTVITHITQPC